MKEILNHHLKDNSGDENITKMIWISVAFIVGAIILAILTNAFRGPIANWFNAKVNEWFNNDNGTLVNTGTLGDATAGSGVSPTQSGSHGFLGDEISFGG